jgi:uncharacterized protein (UPF0264 family)
MTRLLVSVRNEAEAEVACQRGADLIDVKEPAHGSLGAADPATMTAIVERVAGRVPVSVALGELLEGRTLSPALADRLQYAKFGLAGCRQQTDWTGRWARAIEALPPGVLSVAVAYADWQSAGAPDPWTVLAEAERLGCAAILVDTWDKSRGSLVAHWDLAELARWVAAAQEEGLTTALAGSLGWTEMDQVLALAPDFVAVRGAVCTGGRAGQLDAELVHRLARRVQQTASRASEPELTGRAPGMVE